MEKWQNKYRTQSARMEGYDYGQNGAYFITICTRNKQCYFGEILDLPVVETPFMASFEPTMQLNEMGLLAEKYWLEIPSHFPFIELDVHVVMPNHVHGILIINKTLKPEPQTVETPFMASDANEKTRSNKSNSTQPPDTQKTRSIASQQQTEKGGVAGNHNPMFQENISRVIRWYKGRCSFEIRKIHADFAWQSRFHDHIIRNAESLKNIRDYIVNNPSTWKTDKFYSQ
jgi:REP element-mobilizing transposase RayT